LEPINRLRLGLFLVNYLGRLDRKKVLRKEELRRNLLFTNLELNPNFGLDFPGLGDSIGGYSP